MENFQKCQKFFKTKQSHYGRHFQRGTDDSNVFASEHTCLKPTKEKQANKNKQTNKQKT